jgi:two-component system, OmpR family, sensor histidine kinase KdpD
MLQTSKSSVKLFDRSIPSGFKQYLVSGLAIIFTALAFYPLKPYIGYQITAFALLIALSILAIFMGTGPILLAATSGAVLWDYFFLPPPFTLHVDSLEDILMLGMFFIIALLNGILTSRVIKQQQLTLEREEKTNALYQITRELSLSSGIEAVLITAETAIRKYFQMDCAFLLYDGSENPTEMVRYKEGLTLSNLDKSIAFWAFQNNVKTGWNMDSLKASEFTFYPLQGTRLKMGIVAVKLSNPFIPEEEVFWDTFITQISTALERELLNDIARKASALDESDKLYKTLFNSISHELRIPIAAIMGASDTLLSTGYEKLTHDRLCNEISSASARLNRLIENLLNMSRLESGRITPRIDWHDIHDLINQVTDNLEHELSHYSLHVFVPEDMPLVQMDFGLMEQVLHNLVMNSLQNATPGTNIRIHALHEDNHLIIKVMDRGPGFPPLEIPLAFNKFYRMGRTKTGGLGLGLSIVKGFVEAHNGAVKLENRKGGGTMVTLSIPSTSPDLALMQKE